MWPGPFSTIAGPYGNLPLPPQPPRPDPRESQSVDRRLGLWCSCPLLDCCHNEDQEPCGSWGRHVHSGSPASGYLLPWEPGDESWRGTDAADILPARRLRVAPAPSSNSQPD
jgi:hypothetical protein